MHGGPAEQLHIEVSHIELAPAGLAHERECFDKQPLERLAAAGSIAERQAGLFKIEVVLLLERLLERSDLRNTPRPLRKARTDYTAQYIAHAPWVAVARGHKQREAISGTGREG